MCDVAWCSFSWEAFATLFSGAAALFVGVAAVGGAIQVGTRQAAIMEKQTEIAAAQVELERLKLRSELYDKRAEVFETTREWLGAFVREGKIAEGELHGQFRDAIGKAEFLFRPAVGEQLFAWFRMGLEHQYQRMQGDHAAAHEIALQLIDAAGQARHLFEPEMRLSENPPDAPDEQGD